MNHANPLWGAPRIHGELLKLGITLAQRTVANYMVRRARSPSSHNWKAFLRNYLGSTVSVDFLYPAEGRHCEILAASIQASRRLPRPIHPPRPMFPRSFRAVEDHQARLIYRGSLAGAGVDDHRSQGATQPRHGLAGHLGQVHA